MRIFQRLALVLALSSMTAACGGKSKPPSDPPPLAKDPVAEPAGSATPPAQPRAADLSDAEFDALMNQVVGFFGALGDGITAAAKDCKAPEPAKPPAKGKAAPKDKKAPPPAEPAPADPVCTPEQCKVMATNIRDTLGKHVALLEKTKSFGDDEVAAKRAEDWMGKNRERVQPIFQKMAEGLKPCAADPDVNEAIKALGNAGGGG